LAEKKGFPIKKIPKKDVGERECRENRQPRRNAGFEVLIGKKTGHGIPNTVRRKYAL